MITLYDNAFSPFARKVRMVLEYKELEFRVVDGLRADGAAALARVNPRREVPVLEDGDLVVVNSSHIVTYLEEAYTDRPILPRELPARARARHWERISDTLVDPILLCMSIWSWAQRSDSRPAGMEERARADLGTVCAALEQDLTQSTDGFICGALSIADIALFPHLRSAKSFGVAIDPATYPRLAAWLRHMDTQPIARADLQRLKAWLAADKSGYQVRQIFWRGDRMEWLLAAGFHDWFIDEIREGRVLWPQTQYRQAQYK